MDNHSTMNIEKTQAASITATILLVLMMIPTSMNYVSSLRAQSDVTGGDTSSANQDYQEFQSCLSDAEVDGSVSEQQIRDCFAPIYNTGTGTGTDGTTTSPDSPTSDEDTTAADDTGSEGEGGEEGSE